MSRVVDPSGYVGPLRFVEYAVNGRRERGHWDEAESLAARLYQSASRNWAWKDSHVQIAHYGMPLDWAVPITRQREGKEADPDRLIRLEGVPHLANLVLDIDDEDVGSALAQARRVAEWLGGDLGLPDSHYFLYFSTGKGFHVSIPWQLLGVPRTGVRGLNWDTYRLLAGELAELLGLTSLDTGLYRKNGFIRMVNTLHPGTGLFKIRVTPEELLNRSVEELRELAVKPRVLLLPDPEFGDPHPELVALYQKAQVRADRERSERELRFSTVKPLSPEVLAAVGEGLTPCLANIVERVSPRGDNNRNNTAFRAVMMLKHVGKSYEECEAYLRGWLGGAFNEIGARATLDSAFRGPFSGGCGWMRSAGFATLDECAGCPVGQGSVRGKPKREEQPVVVAAAELPSMEQVRVELPMAFEGLKRNNVYVMRTPAGAGKAQPLDAKVLTPTGWAPMGGLQVGSQVIGADGHATEVLEVHPQGKVPVYRVSFSDGSSVEATGDHLWATWNVLDRDCNNNWRTSTYRRPSPKTTLEIAETLMHKGKKNHSIPLVKPVHFRGQAVPMDPYVLGVLLGDGSLTGGVHFTCLENLDIADRVAARLPAGSELVRYRGDRGVWALRGPGGARPNPALDILRDLGLAGCRSHEKFVPEVYLFNSTEVRLELLRGLLDTDGHVMRSRGNPVSPTVGFDSSSEQLANAVRLLVESFGGIAKIVVRKPTFTTAAGAKKEGRPSYRMTIAFPKDMPTPFTTRAKAERWTPPTKYPARRFITAVDYVGEKEAQCITVAAKDHLYVTEHFIVTHNSHASMRNAMRIVDGGGRVLFFVRDTRQKQGLAAEMRDELAKLGYRGKVATLYGRNLNPEEEGFEHVPMNCPAWRRAARYAKRGYSVASGVCRTCVHRDSCGYYGQFDEAYEPGIYIAAHAMLPHLFGGEHEAFASRQAFIKDDGSSDLEGGPGGPLALGGELELIVIDEDTLGDWVESFEVRDYNLAQELKEHIRPVRERDPMTKRMRTVRTINLDANWLRVVRWLKACIGSEGPVVFSLDALAKHEGTSIEAVMHAISPALILDPDFETNGGHRPFTTALYAALMADVKRMRDGNPTVMATADAIAAFSVTQVQLPADVPVMVLDAYARKERYDAFYKAAGVDRPIKYLDFKVREEPKVTYVLGSALTSGTVLRALDQEHSAVARIEKIVKALKKLTEDGQRTLIVARRNLIQSELLQGLLADAPHLVAEAEGVGSLHFWRGRGINAASGERIAVIQDPNPPPAAVMFEASVLHADEPRLDDSRVSASYPVTWAASAEKVEGWAADRWEYADERLNAVQRALREDELVQMSLRGRSITTGAEIILFTDFVDSRLPASRVFLLDQLASDEVPEEDARRFIVEFIHEEAPEFLSVEFLAGLGVVKDYRGKLSGSAVRVASLVRRYFGGHLGRWRRSPSSVEEVEGLLAGVSGGGQ